MPLERTAQVNAYVRELKRRGKLDEVVQSMSQKPGGTDGVPEQHRPRYEAGYRKAAALIAAGKPVPAHTIHSHVTPKGPLAATYWHDRGYNDAIDRANRAGRKVAHPSHEAPDAKPTPPTADPGRPKVWSKAEVSDAVAYASRGKNQARATDRVVAQWEAQKKAAAEYDAKKAAEAAKPRESFDESARKVLAGRGGTLGAVADGLAKMGLGKSDEAKAVRAREAAASAEVSMRDIKAAGLHPHNWGDPVFADGKRGTFDRYERQGDGSIKAIVRIDDKDAKVDPAKMERNLTYADSSSPSQNLASSRVDAPGRPTRANPDVRSDGGYYRVSWVTPGGNERFYTARPPLSNLPGAQNSEWQVIDGTESSGKPVSSRSELHSHVISSIKASPDYRNQADATRQRAEAASASRFAHPVVGPDRPAAAHEALSRLERAKAEGLDTRAALQGGEADRRWKQIQADAAHYGEYGSAAAAFDRMGSGSSAREIPGAGGKAEAARRFGRTGVITSPLLDAQKKSMQENADAARESLQADYEARKKLEADVAARNAARKADLESGDAYRLLGANPMPGTRRQRARAIEAEVSRAVKEVAAQKKAEREARAAKMAPILEAKYGKKDFTPEQLQAATHVRTATGWHKVAKVNAKSVSVETGHSWTDRHAHDKILEVRTIDQATQDAFKAKQAAGSTPSTLAPATVTKGTWVSSRGTLLTEVEKVDTDLLGKMYAAETASLDTGDTSKLSELRKQADAKTEYAFSIGYRNPRTPETPEAYAARTKGEFVSQAVAASEQQVAQRAPQSDVQREFAGNDFNTQRKLVAKYAAEGRATYVPAGARGNSTAEVHVDGVKVGQASSLVDPNLVAEEPGKSTYGERKLVPNGSVPDDPYSRPASPSATPDAPFAQQVSSMTDSKLEYYRKFYNGRTDSISVQNGNAVRAELDRRKAAANKPPTAMEQQRAAIAKMDADAAAGIGKVDFGAPGGPSPRITRENADEVIAAQKKNLEYETEFYNKKGVGGSYLYTPSSRKIAKERIATAKRNIEAAERVKAGGAVRKAKRGELVVFVGKSSYTDASMKTVTTDKVTIGEVTSVDKLGNIKAFRHVDYLSGEGSAPRKMDNAGSDIRNAQQLFIGPDQIDIPAAKEFLRSNGYMPFSSVEEVKNALRQFRIKPGDAGRAEARRRFGKAS